MLRHCYRSNNIIYDFDIHLSTINYYLSLNLDRPLPLKLRDIYTKKDRFRIGRKAITTYYIAPLILRQDTQRTHVHTYVHIRIAFEFYLIYSI